MPKPTAATKAMARGPKLPPEYQGLSRFRRPWRNSSRSGVRELREGEREFQGPVDMPLLHAKVHTRAVASESAHGDRWPDDCDLLFGRFVTIKRTSSIDCNSFGCKYPSAAATRSATRTKNNGGDRPTTGRKASTITFALPLSSISRTRLSKASTIS